MKKDILGRVIKLGDTVAFVNPRSDGRYSSLILGKVTYTNYNEIGVRTYQMNSYKYKDWEYIMDVPGVTLLDLKKDPTSTWRYIRKPDKKLMILKRHQR